MSFPARMPKEQSRSLETRLQVPAPCALWSEELPFYILDLLGLHLRFDKFPCLKVLVSCLTKQQEIRISLQFTDAPAARTGNLHCRVTGDKRGMRKALWDQLTKGDSRGQSFLVEVPSPISSREKIKAPWG